MSHSTWKFGNIFGFLLSQGSVATYCKLGENLCNMYMENFLTNLLVKEFWKSVHICQSYYQTSRGLVFLEHGVATGQWKKSEDTTNYSFWHNPRTWQTHTKTHTAWWHRPRLCIASRGKNCYIAALQSWNDTSVTYQTSNAYSSPSVFLCIFIQSVFQCTDIKTVVCLPWNNN